MSLRLSGSTGLGALGTSATKEQEPCSSREGEKGKGGGETTGGGGWGAYNQHPNQLMETNDRRTAQVPLGSYLESPNSHYRRCRPLFSTRAQVPQGIGFSFPPLHYVVSRKEAIAPPLPGTSRINAARIMASKHRALMHTTCASSFFAM